jgi:hypothetical protein
VRLWHITDKATWETTVRLEHITLGPISKKNATLYLQGTVLAGYTNEEAMPFVVKFDLGNLSCKIYIHIIAHRKSNRLFNI